VSRAQPGLLYSVVLPTRTIPILRSNLFIHPSRVLINTVETRQRTVYRKFFRHCFWRKPAEIYPSPKSDVFVHGEPELHLHRASHVALYLDPLPISRFFAPRARGHSLASSDTLHDLAVLAAENRGPISHSFSLSLSLLMRKREQGLDVL
jgi:hypothetical protein